MAVNLDTIALGPALELLDCLCEQLALTTGGPVCRCCLSLGPAPVDCCDCDGAGTNGEAFVRVARIYPSMGRFPQQSVEHHRCRNTGLAVELELGVYRCSRQVTEDGSAASCADTIRDVEVALDDAAAMRRALCCFDGPDRGPLVIGQWLPYGPEGGCMGGSMSITLQVYDAFPDTLPPVP